MKARFKKARLPLLSSQAEPAGRSAAHAAQAVPDAERVPPGRALVCVSDAGAPELSLRFAGCLLEALRARGREVAALLVAADGQTLAGDVQRIRQLGVDAVFVLDEHALPAAALATFDALPSDCVAVGIGDQLATRLLPLLSVRLSRSLPVVARGSVHADVELGPSIEGAATLIGDWLAGGISAVSRSAARPAAT